MQERDFSGADHKVATQWDKTGISQGFAPDEIRIGRSVQEGLLSGSNTPPSAKWNPASDPHPSVARIIAFDKGGQTHVFGSGTYISAHGQYGIVVTNWHVVRDSAGLVQVHFPDGFASYAAIISYDSTWDLTVLMISKPEAPLVVIAKTAPKVGDPLWIAGYGSGKYRMVGGRCTQYITPEIGLRNEFVELSVEARQGDSGGPIFNQKGELAGVLFGSDNRNTAGSFCGRVRYFLEQSQKRINSVPAEPEKLFAAIEPGLPQHKLDKGAELFRNQIVQSTLTNKDYTNNNSSWPQQWAVSDPKNGRGSASSREVKTATSADRSAVRPGQITFYPNFPDFSRQQPVQIRPQPVQATKSEGQRITLRETPTTPEIRSELLTSKIVNPSQEDQRPSGAGYYGGAEAPVAYPGSGNTPNPSRPRNPQPPIRQTVPVRVAVALEENTDTLRFSEPSERIAMSVPNPAHPPIFNDYTDAEISGAYLSEEILSESQHSGSFFTTLKIIAAIFVVFFVVFHLVKLMSIIEEN